MPPPSTIFGKDADLIRCIIEKYYFTYGIFWRDEGDSLSCGSYFMDPALVQELHANGKPIFVDESKNATFVRDIGMPGRVYSSMRYEWCPNVQSLAAVTFKRADAARRSGIKMVLCLSVHGGVLEVGSHLLIREDQNVVREIKEACKLHEAGGGHLAGVQILSSSSMAATNRGVRSY